MDIQQQTTQPISDDQELAKVLAGVTNMGDNNLEFEETPVPVPAPSSESSPIAEPMPAVVPEPVETPAPDSPQAPIVGYNPPADATPSQGNDDLESIKKEALLELRPLVDKLDLSPEEKFDIYLLLLRSTDDKTLIAPAYEAARGIADETRRAQTLLDIIKEIDYLSGPLQPTV